jgi:hypothetical protein
MQIYFLKLFMTCPIFFLFRCINNSLSLQSYINTFWTSIYNSSVYLGVFFCISGFLLSSLFLREIDVKQDFKWSDFLMVLIHRYMR